MSELELKFYVDPGQRAALLRALGHRKLERVPMAARYFDTADQLLIRHGMTLRIRNEGGRWVQTLNATMPGRIARFEHEVEIEQPGNGVERADSAMARPDRHRGSPIGKRLSALLRRHDGPTLMEVWRTDVSRLRRRLQTHGASIEWALDEGVVSTPDGVRPISELELEFKGGDVAGLFATARDWQSAHGLWFDAISKAERGAVLARGGTYVDAAKARPPDWAGCKPDSVSGGELLRGMVRACLQQILPNASEIAHGSSEPEHVHQLRVGLRRLRTAVHAMTAFAEALPIDWEVGVTPLFDALGKSRDWHVFSTELLPRLQRAGAPVIEDRAGVPDKAEAVTRLVQGAAFQRTLTELMAFAQVSQGQPASRSDRDVDDRAARHLRKTLRRLWRRVLRDASRFDQLPLERQHRVRKELKRLRYLAEFVAPWFAPKPVKAWLKRVAPAQDALGAHLDRCQAVVRLTHDAESTPTAWFGVGWLRAKTRESARESCRMLRRLGRATPFWESGAAS